MTMSKTDVGEVVERLRNLRAWMLEEDLDMRAPENTVDPDLAADLLQSLSERVEELEKERQEQALQELADIGQEMDALNQARNQALEEAAQIARDACLVPPDGGAPTEDEARVCDEAARQIRSLKTEEE